MYCGWHQIKIEHKNELGGGLARIIDETPYKDLIISFSKMDGFRDIEAGKNTKGFVEIGHFKTVRSNA